MSALEFERASQMSLSSFLRIWVAPEPHIIIEIECKVIAVDSKAVVFFHILTEEHYLNEMMCVGVARPAVFMYIFIRSEVLLVLYMLVMNVIVE